MASGERIGARFDRWVDEWKMAMSGVLLATRSPKFLIPLVLSFLVFGTLMNFLASGSAALNLFWASDFSGKLSILGDSFLAVFGVGRSLTDWLLVFVISVLQAILIGLVVFVWQQKRRNKRERQQAGLQNADNLQSAGIVAGLAILGSGCPTCGTTLLMPVLGALFSSSSYMLASTVSGILTAAAIILALFSLKRIGKEAYVLILSDHYLQKHRQTNPSGKEK